MNQGKEGFTLIELMIVIGIIGIIAMIAIPNYINYRNNAFCASTEDAAHRISMIIADYFTIPTKTSMNKDDIKLRLKGDRYSEYFTPSPLILPNTNITITVTDFSGSCPTEYKEAMPIKNGTGWDDDFYQKVMRISRNNPASGFRTLTTTVKCRNLGL